jgi:hypothetical protein
MDLPEGEGSVFPLTTKGVGLAQIPLVLMKAGRVTALPPLAVVGLKDCRPISVSSDVERLS